MTIRSRRIQSFIERQKGVHPVPYSLSSPIVIHGENIDATVEVPLATTERGLVAGINRGCKAITLSGGSTTCVYRKSMTRAPVFAATNVKDAVRAFRKLQEIQLEINEWPEGQSKHVRLIESRPYILGQYIYLRLRFDVGDALGGNAVTILSDSIVRRVCKVTQTKCLGVSGNLCSDKKPAAINVLDGRGLGVIAEVILTSDILKHVLHVGVEPLLDLAVAKLQLGSSLAGAPYHQNAHVANSLAAMFIPFGQDVAEIVESSSATLVGSRVDEGVRFVLTLPCMELGVVGGGTDYKPCRENLDRLGCNPDETRRGYAVSRLGEIVASVCLAGEISLLSALAEGSFGSVSASIGRGQQLK
ncbi:MAG: 3-hydroxy-3-methylglutaryl-CoA reductase [Ignavibacteriae bacterium]|nr:3-hydroxy-3-methylglutaryl-CoA reductase [Ignavibacteriota bacterium]